MAGMKRYSIDSDVREKAVKYCVVLSLCLSLAIDWLVIPAAETILLSIGLGPVVSRLASVGLFGQIAPFALFGLLWWLYDNHIWRFGSFVKLHGVPNLNGIWSGTGYSSFKDPNGDHVEYEMALEITQTFTKMNCVSHLNSSESEANIIGLVGCKDGDSRYRLEFSYGNIAGESSIKIDTWQDKHEGFNVIVCEGTHMNGHYFTNRNCATRGTFSLDKRMKAK